MNGCTVGDKCHSVIRSRESKMIIHNLFMNKFTIFTKNQDCVLMTDMQTPPLKSVPSQVVIMNGAECSEYNGENNKKILRFLFFELSSKIGVIFSEKWH